MELPFQDLEVKFLLLLISHIKNYYLSLNGAVPSTSVSKKIWILMSKVPKGNVTYAFYVRMRFLLIWQSEKKKKKIPGIKLNITSGGVVYIAKET